MLHYLSSRVLFQNSLYQKVDRLVGYILWHINSFRLLNAKSCLYVSKLSTSWKVCFLFLFLIDFCGYLCKYLKLMTETNATKNCFFVFVSICFLLLFFTNPYSFYSFLSFFILFFAFLKHVRSFLSIPFVFVFAFCFCSVLSYFVFCFFFFKRIRFNEVLFCG